MPASVSVVRENSEAHPCIREPGGELTRSEVRGAEGSEEVALLAVFGVGVVEVVEEPAPPRLVIDDVVVDRGGRGRESGGGAVGLEGGLAVERRRARRGNRFEAVFGALFDQLEVDFELSIGETQRPHALRNIGRYLSGGLRQCSTIGRPDGVGEQRAPLLPDLRDPCMVG